MKNENQQLSYKKIFIFWYPLAATWLMMAVENPLLTSIIARLAEPKFNLAAFGVAFSFALIVEAPIIMIMSASTALVNNKDAFYKLRKFIYSLNFLITAIMMIGLLPPVFYFVTETLIGLPHYVAKLTHISSIILLPWPAAIGYRRFYQGILIRFNRTRVVAYGTVVRVLSMGLSALILYSTDIPGAYVGASALSIGVVMEALASRLMVTGSLKVLLAEEDRKKEKTDNDEKPLTFRFIVKFYYPLALMTMLSLGVHPLVTFFMGKGRLPIESLAVLPVINALVFIFRSVGLSYTEVAIALLGKDAKNYIPLRNFAIGLIILVVGVLSIIAFTPLLTLWYSKVAGLSASLTRFSILPTRLMVLLPGLTVFIAIQRALLVNSKNTSPITYATFIEVSVIITIMLLSTSYFNWIGVVAASAAYTLGRLCANAYLLPHHRAVVRPRVNS